MNTKLQEAEIKKLDALLQACSVAGIEKLIIADGKVRGVDEALRVVLISDQGVPDLDGKKIGLNRLNVLRNRMALVSSDPNFAITMVEAKNGTDISHIELSAKNTKAQFRCSAVDAMKGVPKGFNDSAEWFVEVPADTIKLLKQAVSAMELEGVIVTGKPDGTVCFEGIDKNKDNFNTKFADKAVWIPEDKPEPTTPVFCHEYPAKSLLPLLWYTSQNGVNNVGITLGGQGVLTIIMNGMDFYVVPTRG
jgi:hypothetical protein